MEILGSEKYPVLKDILIFFTYIYHTWRPPPKKKMKINNKKMLLKRRRHEKIFHVSCAVCLHVHVPGHTIWKASAAHLVFDENISFSSFIWIRIFFLIYEKMKIEKKIFFLPFFKPQWIILNEKCLFFICISFSLTHSLLFTYI